MTFWQGTAFEGLSHLPGAGGDAIFVPAGTVHRFEDFTDDLVVWVVFV